MNKSLPSATLPARQRVFGWVSWAIKRAVVGYAILLGVLMMFEGKLVYPGSKYPRGDWTPTDFEFEEVKFQASDSTQLVGWYLPRPTAPPGSQRPSGSQQARDFPTAPLSETVLLCHGNAENVAQSAAYVGQLTRMTLNADVFVFDYRGYGKSAGSPNEAGLLDDAESALQWLCERTGKRPTEITVLGHSIGGGPACHLAAKFNCRALILQRTFSSLVDAAQANYPLFPVRYLMRNRFLSVEKIKNYAGPVFQSHGAIDGMIPIRLARKLFDAAPTKTKQFYEVPNMGHNDPLPEAYWHELRAFFERL